MIILQCYAIPTVVDYIVTSIIIVFFVVETLPTCGLKLELSTPGIDRRSVLTLRVTPNDD
ncbi:hypothetical protein CHS0354_014375, partial [Potamilus streckersoni]